MLGTILNVAAILIGAIAGLMVKKQPSGATQSFFKVALGALTVYFGLRLTWLGLNGSFWQVLKQIGIVLLALMLGNLTGKLLRLQKTSNRIGQFARDRMAAATPDNPQRFSDGFQSVVYDRWGSSSPLSWMVPTRSATPAMAMTDNDPLLRGTGKTSHPTIARKRGRMPRG